MNFFVPRALSALVVVLSLFAAPAAAQTEYRDPGAYCSFTMPKDWKQAQPDKVEALKLDKTITSVSFRTAFAKTLKNGVPQLPYVIVALQPVSMRGVNYENIKEKYESELRTPVFGGVQSGEVDFYLDAIIHNLTIHGAKNSTTKAIIYSFPMKDGLLHLACFEDAKRFDKTAPLFEEIAQSCTIDKVQEFNPETAGSSRRGRRGYFGIGGLGIGLVILVLRYWASR